MNQLIFYIRKHLSEHANQGWRGVLFLCLFPLFAFSCVAYRYVSNLDIYFQSNENALIFKGLFFTFPFLTVIFAFIFLCKPAVENQRFDVLKKRGFWQLCVLILSVLFLNQYGYIFETKGLPIATHYFFNKVFFNIECCIFYLILPIFYWFFEHHKSNPEWRFYGFSKQGFSYQPYLLMFMLMLPLLYWASLRPDFLHTYPRYKSGDAEQYWQISPSITIFVYELTYCLQFVCLELFFRGFIVLSLSKYLGSGSVWVMVIVYVFIHFGKPLPETIGSFFGGYILGVIAYYSRSVFGGIFIHIAVALGMEFFAYLSK
ncbi:MAG: CPBP family intramembrane metalloprotease [Cytophagales bacterium]|nr:MAG: CPBP family intramembrane metalloprotease [Cytophagales bacterium]